MFSRCFALSQDSFGVYGRLPLAARRQAAAKLRQAGAAEAQGGSLGGRKNNDNAESTFPESSSSTSSSLTRAPVTHERTTAGRFRFPLGFLRRSLPSSASLPENEVMTSAKKHTTNASANGGVTKRNVPQAGPVALDKSNDARDKAGQVGLSVGRSSSAHESRVQSTIPATQTHPGGTTDASVVPAKAQKKRRQFSIIRFGTGGGSSDRSTTSKKTSQIEPKRSLPGGTITEAGRVSNGTDLAERADGSDRDMRRFSDAAMAVQPSSVGYDPCDATGLANLGSPECPRLDDIPTLEPILCKSLSSERLTDVVFLEECLLVACQDGIVQVWARPEFVSPTHGARLDSRASQVSRASTLSRCSSAGPVGVGRQRDAAVTPPLAESSYPPSSRTQPNRLPQPPLATESTTAVAYSPPVHPHRMTSQTSTTESPPNNSPPPLAPPLKASTVSDGAGRFSAVLPRSVALYAGGVYVGPGPDSGEERRTSDIRPMLKRPTQARQIVTHQPDATNVDAKTFRVSGDSERATPSPSHHPLPNQIPARSAASGDGNDPFYSDADAADIESNIGQNAVTSRQQSAVSDDDVVQHPSAALASSSRRSGSTMTPSSSLSAKSTVTTSARSSTSPTSAGVDAYTSDTISDNDRHRSPPASRHLAPTGVYL